MNILIHIKLQNVNINSIKYNNHCHSNKVCYLELFCYKFITTVYNLNTNMYTFKHCY